jgi:KamA family protein
MFKVYGANNFHTIPQIHLLTEDQQLAIKVVAQVLPFKVNQYVIDELIDWDNVPNDPVFQLTFPQPGMLDEKDYNELREHIVAHKETKHIVNRIRQSLNPHPAGQQTLNIPTLDNEPLEGMQHKYRETVLFFPARGQTCHSYCTFCFRWAQFIGDNDLKFSSSESTHLLNYLKEHKEVTDLLVTGGDPMIMRSHHLAEYLLPLLEPEFDHIQNIRIGTKVLSFWPQRFLTDKDSYALLELLTRLVRRGKHVAIMTHINHWQEIQTPIAKEAIRRLRETGAVLRSQSPLVKHINDDPNVWAKMWTEQVRLGIVPYYMFIERDTGAKKYFELPLYKAYEIYNDAIKQVSGLSRTVRGPSMSCTPGKVEIQGITEIKGEKVFILRMLQCRNPEYSYQTFFAEYNEDACWLDDLKPAFGESKFFFEN